VTAVSNYGNVPIVSVIGEKNSGKTTLIEQLVSLLKKEGHRVGVMKYALRRFQMDREGKDTYRFYQSGADAVGIASNDQMAFLKRIDSAPPLGKVLESHFSDADIVLVEGYRGDDYPRICLTVRGKEAAGEKTAAEEGGQPVLKLGVSALDGPISHEVLEDALEFVKDTIKAHNG
jgi:molybdopterin-guanine dinucleotide biosynthesis protein B